MEMMSASGEGATALEKHLAALRVKFLQNLAQHEQELEDAITSLAAYGINQKLLSRIYYFAHNLVGMAPMHKLDGLAEAARKTETLLVQAVLPPHAILELDDVLLSADDLAEEVRAALEECWRL